MALSTKEACPVCGTEVAKLARHLFYVHSTPKDEIEVIRTERRIAKALGETNSAYLCECGAVYQVKKGLEKHMKERHPEESKPTTMYVTCQPCEGKSKVQFIVGDMKFGGKESSHCAHVRNAYNLYACVDDIKKSFLESMKRVIGIFDDSVSITKDDVSYFLNGTYQRYYGTPFWPKSLQTTLDCGEGASTAAQEPETQLASSEKAPDDYEETQDGSNVRLKRKRRRIDSGKETVLGDEESSKDVSRMKLMNEVGTDSGTPDQSDQSEEVDLGNFVPHIISFD